MSKRVLIFIAVLWVALMLVNYYFIPYFIRLIIWLVLTLFLLTVLVIQLLKLIKERKQLKKLRILNVIVFISLFTLTFFYSLVNRVIERVDWFILNKKRTEIVEQVKENRLNPNVDWNNWLCELPFKLPVVSNGGNDIGIYRDEANGYTTVTFWVFRNYFEQPSTEIVYSDNPNIIERIENKIKETPKENWKIRDSWYRIKGGF